MLLGDSIFKVLFRGPLKRRNWLQPGDVVSASAESAAFGLHLGVTRNVVHDAEGWVWRDVGVAELPMDWAPLRVSMGAFAVVFLLGVMCGRRFGAPRKLKED